MHSRSGRWVRLAVGALILGVLVWRLGAGPFIAGIRTIDGSVLVAAAAITMVTTVCSAWRWTLVARGLGIDLPLPAAVAAYYRAQFLNTTLPGGVVGDVHRAVRHGRSIGDVGLAARAVVWERSAGQVVQLTLSVLVLAVVSSPIRSSIPVVVAGVLGGVVVIAILGRAVPHNGPSRWARALRTARGDARSALLARRFWPGILGSSALVVAGHVATFVIAARTAGSTASIDRLVPLALLVLLAMALPTNIGGWGPREGVAAWGFGAAGLGAGLGVASATVYGILVLVASIPGAAVMVLAARRRDAPRPDGRPASDDAAVQAGFSGARHG